eukprot:GHRR01036477.1.p1 GENE.GHRR01036477.1~~GHRR01036477.1.p1  ORF type:complete len:136 (+),score=47.93 GHRR01036477.1:285-692(+)
MALAEVLLACSRPNPAALLANAVDIFVMLLLCRYEAYSQRILASLQQQPGHPVPLEDLVVILFGIQNGFADTIHPKDVGNFFAEALQHIRKENSKVLADIAASKQLTAASEKGIRKALELLLKQRGAQSGGASAA